MTRTRISTPQSLAIIILSILNIALLISHPLIPSFLPAMVTTVAAHNPAPPPPTQVSPVETHPIQTTLKQKQKKKKKQKQKQKKKKKKREAVNQILLESAWFDF
ncbi:hypothetical protein TrLO_g15344 [Triparma laevis f. longispina]|uniref:Uncharacterized protein n=1 Tax=Triparma laevis f. longispina TaxID=1714387 RepID=A0A9W7KSK2_9STRA|nr:hypothetical protein TrLO_g15344 [Triparma laevis f. longispina]